MMLAPHVHGTHTPSADPQQNLIPRLQPSADKVHAVYKLVTVGQDEPLCRGPGSRCVPQLIFQVLDRHALDNLHHKTHATSRAADGNMTCNLSQEPETGQHDHTDMQVIG
jgi:hypothetical protein